MASQESGAKVKLQRAICRRHIQTVPFSTTQFNEAIALGRSENLKTY